MFSETSTGGFIYGWEYILAPSYLILIYAFAFIIREKFYRKSPLKKYFFPGLTVKLIGAVSVCLIYNYHYGGGDTTFYFKEGKHISSIVMTNFYDGIRLLFSTAGNFDPDLLKYTASMEFATVESSYMIVKISALLQLLSFQSFIITSLFFALVSFWGVWRIFCVFSQYYPTLTKEFAIAFLFIPSVFFWGSGILKDTVCLASLCIFFCSVDGFFLKNKNLISNSIGIIIPCYIMLMVKVYIIMSFSLCIILLVLLNYRSKIKSKSLRIFITPIFISIALFVCFFLSQFLSENSASNKYSADKIMETSTITREYIASVGGGSTYSLGTIDNSLLGMIKLIPAGINVTLFRPYLWESHNFIALIAALESFWILILTIKVMYKTGFLNFFRIIASQNLILFCLLFSLIFAYAVGISSYNFGTLVRYKIPCIPFYIIAIQLVHYHYKNPNTKKKIPSPKVLSYSL